MIYRQSGTFWTQLGVVSGYQELRRLIPDKASSSDTSATHPVNVENKTRLLSVTDLQLKLSKESCYCVELPVQNVRVNNYHVNVPNKSTLFCIRE